MSIFSSAFYFIGGSNLLWLAYEDLKHQSIPAVSLGIHAIWCFSIVYNQWAGAANSFVEVSVNISFLVLQFTIVSLVMYCKKTNFSWRESFGLGDFFFILFNAICWQTNIFLAAYLVGLIGGVFLAFFLAKAWPKAKQSIPLITTLAIAQLFALLYFVYF